MHRDQKHGVLTRRQQIAVNTIIIDSEDLITRARNRKYIDDIEVEVPVLPPRRKKLVMDDDEGEHYESSSVMEIPNLSGSKIKTKLIKKQDLVLNVAQEDLTHCPICFNDLAKLQAVTLPCFHIFCLKCLKNQAENYANSCPMCRQKFKHYTHCTSEEIKSKLRRRTDSLKKRNHKSKKSIADPYPSNKIHPVLILLILDDAEDSFLVVDDQFCQECGCMEDMEAMLFCRRCQCVVVHMYCTNQTSVLCNSCRRNN